MVLPAAYGFVGLAAGERVAIGALGPSLPLLSCIVRPKDNPQTPLHLAEHGEEAVCQARCGGGYHAILHGGSSRGVPFRGN